VLEAWITALRPDARGFFAQDAASARSGIEVYASSGAPPLRVGDRALVFGFSHHFEGRDELLLSSATLLEHGSVPAALDVSAESIADGGALSAELDGMLVRVRDAVVLAANADAPNDYDETLLEGGLRLDDRLFPELDNDFVAGARLDVTGVLGYSFGHWKLWPRSRDDLVPR
jgi:hypothetical protein